MIVHVSFSLPYFAICDRGARLFEKWYYFVIAFMSLSGINVFNVILLLNETAATRRLLSGFRYLGVCRAFFELVLMQTCCTPLSMRDVESDGSLRRLQRCLIF